MSSRLSHSRSDQDRDLVGAGALQGASIALLATAVIGGTALLLDHLWPWLAWGYVVLALACGLALALIASRARTALEREVDGVRRQYRSR